MAIGLCSGNMSEAEVRNLSITATIPTSDDDRSDCRSKFSPAMPPGPAGVR